ncbi:MAG: helix-turn-helix transcriptional regulator [Bacilli bacterium]|nr:helix-turn-helix transcriptional regulator [Bacilli bacterium]
MNFPNIIKALRENLLVTQTELANMLGVSFATVNRWENGHFEPSIRQRRMIRDLCRKNKIPFE